MLARKWTLARQAKLRMEDLDRMVRQRTEELVVANQSLQQEIEERIRVQDACAPAKSASRKPSAPARSNSHPKRHGPAFPRRKSSFLELSVIRPRNWPKPSPRKSSFGRKAARPDRILSCRKAASATNPVSSGAGMDQPARHCCPPNPRPRDIPACSSSSKTSPIN